MRKRIYGSLLTMLFVGTFSFASATDKQPRLEAGFSPDGGASKLVLRVIDNARHSLQVMAYVFTSREITTALIRAHKRGIKVQLLVDAKANFGNNSKRSNFQHNRHSIWALDRCRKGGVQVRTIRLRGALAHDKFIIADAQHVQTGSFNYTQSAAKRNSENVLVVWDNPDLASRYIRHWQKYWKKAKDY